MMMSAWVVTGHPVTLHSGQIFLHVCVKATSCLYVWEEAYYVGNACQLPYQMNCANGLQALWVLLANVILVV